MRETEAPAGPIRIRPGEEGRLIVSLPYSPERVEKIKTLDGRRWHPAEKYWTVPRTEDMPARLSALFAGENIELAEGLRRGGAPPAAAASSQRGLVERVRTAIEARHLSPRTEEAYLGWIDRFRRFSGRDLETLGKAEIRRFLSSLATEGRVSASTPNQALHSLLFLYQEILGKEIGLLDGVVRAKQPGRLPVVLSKEEVRRVLGAMCGAPRLMAMLLYGAGPRLMECCSFGSRTSIFPGIRSSSGRAGEQGPLYHASRRGAGAFDAAPGKSAQPASRGPSDRPGQGRLAQRIG